MSPFINPPFIIAILIAISVHEWAHGVVARLLGDPTAEAHGRLTLNPLAHLDLTGAIMFLIVGCGWAKPVPVNPSYFSHPKRDNALVACAGPLSNLIIAIVSFIGLLILMPSSQGASSAMSLLSIETNASIVQVFLMQVFASSLFINLALMAFNLLPVAPLDGSKILQSFIPYRYEMSYERFMQQGPIILLALILGGIFLNIPILSAWVFGIIDPVLQIMWWIGTMVTG